MLSVFYLLYLEDPTFSVPNSATNRGGTETKEWDEFNYLIINIAKTYKQLYY